MKERLKELRKKLGLKQREVAEKLEVPVSNVGSWESGSKPIPKTRIYQICNEFHVRRDWLEKGEGEMFEPTPEPISVEEAQAQFVEAVFRQLTDEQRDIVAKAIERANEELRQGEKK